MTQETTTHEAKRQQRDMETIKRIVAEHHGLTAAELLANHRREPLVTIRQMAMVVCRQLTDASSMDVARAFGKKDHETVLHAQRAMSDKAFSSPDLAHTFEKLLSKCYEQLAKTK